MAYSTTYLYPEDLNGTLPSNLIPSEVQTLQAPGPTDYYFIIPKAAPFFVDSLIIVNPANGQPYVEGDDYQVGHLFIEAMNSTGRPIAGSIRFMRPTIVGQVRLTYRTIGGPWGFSDQAILRELSNKHLNPLIRSWGDIDVLPYAFPPLPHDQRIDSLVGSAEINATLEKIAEILEATAEGTSKSHIDNRNNPHVVTAFQVGLGNVPNFQMANDQQHLDAARNDLFTNPRGVLLLVNKYAVTPLTAHIQAKGNVHDMVPADIGLGNVPNWKPATPQNAIDPTNNTSFMTPYTTSLLIQKLQNDPRLDQLIIDFNNHLTAQNPHHITPSLIGTYTSQQIDAMIDAISQGGDAATFDGKTPDEWVAMFPAVADINQMLQELFDLYLSASSTLGALDVEDPVTPEDAALRASQKISWAYADYQAYALYNSLGAGQIIADTAYSQDFPTGTLVGAAGKWSTTVNAAYYINPLGYIETAGTGAIVIPAKYAAGSTDVTGKASLVYASKDCIYLIRSTDTVLIRIDRSSTVTTVGAQIDIAALFCNNGLTDPRPFSVTEIQPQTGARSWNAQGDASWVTAFNAVKTRASTGSFTIEEVRIGSGYLIVMVDKAGVTSLWIYRINYGGSITLTDVSATTLLRDHSTGLSVAASTVNGISGISGNFDHFVFIQPIGPGSILCDLLSFGDETKGQLEITSASVPFIAAVAGFGFTVTVNQNNFAEFWGDSPDNSMLWRGGKYIEPVGP
jgi:hypothetical protein